MFSHSARSSLLLTLALAGAVLLPSSVRAQQSAGDSEVAVTLVRPATLATAPLGTRVGTELFGTRAAAVPLEAVLPQDRVRAGPNIAMMVAGGAGLVTGLVIGGDTGMIIATTGGVVGLIGLYRYLR